MLFNNRLFGNRYAGQVNPPDPPTEEDSVPWAMDGNNYVAESASVIATITPSTQVISLYDKRSTKTRTTASAGNTVTNITNANNVLTLTTSTKAFAFTLVGNDLIIDITASETLSMSDFIFPAKVLSLSTDYMIVPYTTGVVAPVTSDYPINASAFFAMYWNKAVMSFVGITGLTDGDGYMFASEDPYDTYCYINKSGDTYANIKLYHKAVKGTFGYNRRVHFVSIAGGYLEMCTKYRTITDALGWNKTFALKAVDNPNVTKLKGYVDFWTYQMPLNSDSAVDNLIKFGIDRAMFSIHSSQFGTAGVNIIRYNNRGFLTTTYDNIIDVYPNGTLGYYEGGYPESCYQKQDGSYVLGYVVNGHQGYFLCQVTQRAKDRLPTLTTLQTYPLNSRYIDVEFSQGLLECFNTNHPLTRKGDSQERTSRMATLHDDYKVVTGTEEGRCTSYRVLDYSVGSMSVFTPESKINWWTPITGSVGTNYLTYCLSPVYRIPLTQLCFHDSHMAIWGHGDNITMTGYQYWDDKDLFNYLYGIAPSFFPTTSNWATYFERWLQSYHLSSAVQRYTAFDKMTSHSFITTDRYVQRTDFESGWYVVANFNGASYDYNGTVISAKGFYATDGTYEAFKKVDSGTNLAASYVPNRLYVNAYTVEHTYRGVKTTGSVFLRNDVTRIHVAFIGTQSSIKLNPTLTPWPFNHAYNEAGTPLTMTDVGGGYYQINKSTTNFIYLTNE